MFPNVSRFFFHARFIARNGKVMSDDSKIIVEEKWTNKAIFLTKMAPRSQQTDLLSD